MSVTFEVVGLPVQQGSKKHVGNGVMVETKKADLLPWRDSIAAVARQLDCEQFDGPLHLDVTFRFPAPQSRRRKVAECDGWKDTAPDLDKLIRAVGDALTASALIRDDARIARLTATKVETVGWLGAVITVAALEPAVLDGAR